MKKYFNTEGVCIPAEHYMVDLQKRLIEIREQFIEKGKYFTINRARQYGKTTTLQALAEFLKDEYIVVEMDFQMLSHGDFESEASFIKAFSYELMNWASGQEQACELLKEYLKTLMKSDEKERTFSELFRFLSMWCAGSEKPVVLIIDEVDSATNNQVFLDFLSQGILYS